MGKVVEVRFLENMRVSPCARVSVKVDWKSRGFGAQIFKDAVPSSASLTLKLTSVLATPTTCDNDVTHAQSS